MFSEALKMTNEDKINMLSGFLPDPIHILTITPATGFYAKFKNKQSEESYLPLVGWAYLKNGAMLPLLYRNEYRCHFIAYAMDGFIMVVWEDDVPDEDDEDDEDDKEKNYKPKK